MGIRKVVAVVENGGDCRGELPTWKPGSNTIPARMTQPVVEYN